MRVIHFVYFSIRKSSVHLLFLIFAASIYAISKEANQILVAPLDSANPSNTQSSYLSPHRVHDLTLRHIFHHGTYLNPNLHKQLDVRPGEDLWITEEYSSENFNGRSFRVQSRPLKIQRLLDRSTAVIESLIRYAQASGFAAILEPSDWTIDDVSGPDISNKETIVNLASMTSNAYIMNPKTGEWEDVDGGFNVSKSFGWKEDGLRGHIYADEGNETIIITLKGTTLGIFLGSGTMLNDKVNDNLLCGCCCGQQGHFFYRKVCNCATTTFTCNGTCLAQELRMENRYYQAALKLYGNVSKIYPNSNIWVSGHSLGGAVSSLLGLTFGLPVVTFEAPGDALAASRLGLPSPPNSHHSIPQTRKNTGIYHFGQTADPIFMGSCNSITSGCTLAGYAFESQCHTGQTCVYDTVEDKGWRVSILNHPIMGVIHNVLKVYDKVPPCKSEHECVDCFNWKFFQSNGSESTTSAASSSTSTSRTTCYTPGMFSTFSHIKLWLIFIYAGGAVVMSQHRFRVRKARQTSSAPAVGGLGDVLINQRIQKSAQHPS